MNQPGYWSQVFDAATKLLKARPELNGDQAYWLARRIVDQSLQEALPLLQGAQ